MGVTMTDTTHNPQADDSTSSDRWGMIDELQATLANAHRLHARGDSLPVEDVLKQADDYLQKLRTPLDPSQFGESVRDLLDGYWEQIKARKARVPTGFASLNRALGDGFEPKRLLVLLGAPGAGKTALANQIAD